MDDELRQELEALSNGDLEASAGAHFTLTDGHSPEIRAMIRNKQAAAQEILNGRVKNQTPDTWHSTTMLSPSEIESLRQETQQASAQMRAILASRKMQGQA